MVEWELEWIAGVLFSSLCSSVWLSAEWRRLWSLSSSMQSSGGDGDTRLPGRVVWSSDGQVVEVNTVDLAVEWIDRVTLVGVLGQGVEWWGEVVKSYTRPGGRVVCWGREASTRPGGRVVWHDQVRFFQLARQQLRITWKQHKYATCMQNYPKHTKCWQMMRNGIKQWWYGAKVMTNGCSKYAKYTVIIG